MLQATQAAGIEPVLSDSRQGLVLTGLIGSGIQASGSPAMHEAEGRRLGLRHAYRLLDLDRIPGGAEALPKVLDAAEWFGFAGLNITHPCKQSVIAYLSELGPNAKAIGAVNTVVFRDGRRTGHNTDHYGFCESFRRELGGAALGTVLQLGAGGAGFAVGNALKDLGVRQLLIFDKDRERAEALAARIVGRFGDGAASIVSNIEKAARAADGIVNTTPVGMEKYPGMPIDPALLKAGQWVADIIYFPRETELLRRARALGLRTMSGEGMAVFQAARAFELFTGIQPDSARMRAVLAGDGRTATD